MDRLTQAVVALSRRPGWVGVLFIDLDSFKEINDTFGHDTGDEVIIEAGERLVTTARRVDTVARLGGDELVVLCNELRGRGCLSTVADRLVKALRVPSRAEIEPLALRASVGAACTDDPDCDPMELLHQADLAMYAAKRAGGDRYAVYDAALPGRPRRGARVGLGVDATAEAGAGASLGSVTPVAPANAA
jgi:diguanylate cyclase (GGDEF)-like protein